MADIEELQSQANALLGSAPSQSAAVTAALAEDDPGAPFSAFIPEQAAEAVEVAESPGGLAARVARPGPLRGPQFAQVVAIHDRHQHVPEPARQTAQAGAAG